MMSKEDWALALAKARGLEEIGEILFVLSDEDWVNDTNREWLRSSPAITPLCLTGEPAQWLNGIDQLYWHTTSYLGILPPRVFAGLGVVRGCTTHPNSWHYLSPEAAWLDLLEAVSTHDEQK